MRQNTSLTVIKHGALAHLARAFDWQSRGDQFESGMLHQSERIKKKFLVRFLLYHHKGEIVDTCNYVIHGYDSVTDDIMWGIVVRHLPILKVEVERLLESIG